MKKKKRWKERKKKIIIPRRVILERLEQSSVSYSVGVSQYKIPHFGQFQFWLPCFGLSQCEVYQLSLSQHRLPEVLGNKCFENETFHPRYNTEIYTFATLT